ncbi:MAG: cation:proton antiporter [Chitinophagaceae bacterium]
MNDLNAYVLIIASCLLVIFSYLFNLLSRKTGIPSVLLLMLMGIGVREFLKGNKFSVDISPRLVEIFGIIGLIMIILEAGLDLRIGKNKVLLIRNAFFSAISILILSTLACSAFLYYYLKADYLYCLLYALPLSVVSSAIVIPSISHLSDHKKEFLVYETSFSDIIGIILFNYLIAGNFLKGSNIVWFFGSMVIAFVLSVVLSFIMLFMLTRITTKVRFFLVFAVLIFLYAGGKMLNLPALFIILLFGLVVSNWETSYFKNLYNWISVKQVNDVSHLLHSLTAESSFLIRTFFFFIFGLTIDVALILDTEVILAGSAIVMLLLGVRFIYLRFFLRSHIFPELFFMPRGLITILLLYSIPEADRLSKFNEGILFFVILISSIIMMVGSIAYGKPKMEVINDEMPIDEQVSEDDIMINNG